MYSVNAFCFFRCWSTMIAQIPEELQKKLGFFSGKKENKPMKVLSLIYVCAFSVSFLCTFFLLFLLSASVTHTCFLSRSSGLVSSSLAFDHWIVREPSELRMYKNTLWYRKACKENPLALEFNCSLLLLKQLSCVVDRVTTHVKCCSWFSGCRLCHRSDGVLDKDHNSRGQGTTRLLWLQWWWQESSYHRQWVSFWPHSYFCKYQRRNDIKCWMAVEEISAVQSFK